MKTLKTTVLILLMFSMGMTVYAAPGETREDKMERYKILYGEDAPVEEIRPALAPETESGPETEAETEAGAETEPETENVADTFRMYADLFQDEEKMYIPEAIKKLDEMGDDAGDTTHYKELLTSLMLCQGIYVHESQYTDSDDVYTADVEIFLKNGIPTCIIDYTGYVGYLEEAEITEFHDEEYEFLSRPIGKMAGYGQEFYIAFNKDNMHIIWGEGSCEYYLTKATGSAKELDGDDTPFTESDFYQTLVEKVDEELGSLEHQVSYDNKSRTFTIYLVINKNGRQKALNNAALIKDSWNPILENLKPFTEGISTALTMATRDGFYDINDAHCIIMIVDELNDENLYFPQDKWAVIKDGNVDYDFLDDGTSSLSVESPESSAQSVGNYDSGSNSYDSWDYNSYSASSGERNAVQKAKDYLAVMHFSYQGLVDQLEYEGYSYSEAVYGADHCGADWFEQAAGKAKDYLDVMSFSYDGLVEQLEFEGFTHEQAVYGANKSY